MFVASAQSTSRKCYKKKLQVWKSKQKYYNYALGKLMYSRACPLDDDHVLCAQLEIDIMATKYPNTSQFITYFIDHWAHKATMWCVGNHNISHVGQDTNETMDSFHNNMK
jgi:hypothetical protein